MAAKNATTIIPIIMTVASDPVGTGLIASLARPGGNVTGLSSFGPESSGKQLGLLKEVIPGLSRVAAFAYNANPAYTLQLREVEDAAQALKLQVQVLEVREANDFDGAFGAAKKGRAEAINTLTSAFLTAHTRKLVQSAEKSKLPAIYHNTGFVDAGGAYRLWAERCGNLPQRGSRQRAQELCCSAYFLRSNPLPQKHSLAV